MKDLAQFFAAFADEFGRVFSEGGFAVWSLLILGGLLYATLFHLAVELIRLGDLRRGELPAKFRAPLAAATDKREVEHLFARLELDRLAFIQRRIPFAVILTGVAPLAGLLGTVSGMLVTFAGLANASAAKPIEKISAGVSEALITTQAGLVIAIPAAILTALIRSQASRAEGAVQGLMHREMACLQPATR